MAAPTEGGVPSVHPKFGSGVETDDATPAPRGYEKASDSHTEALWGEQGGLRAGLKMG